ncbi:ABC transporter ATP-binding protein [Amorphus sp. 3PC139-8]|uniref:ABC transporter ATP-binding protein n=1 Tax=Amorphus sp. 3PC139-8 TaxID=2735676 RepID=UPI00345DACD8
MTSSAETDEVPDVSNLELVKRFAGHLSAQRRREFIGLALLSFVGAISELVTLGAVLPFLAVLFDAQSTASSGASAAIENLLPAAVMQSPDALYWVSGILIAVVLTASLLRCVMYWVLFKYVFAMAHDFSIDIYRKALYQPYTYHLNKNSGDILAITNTVQVLLYYVLLPAFEAVMAAFVAVFIVAGLLVIDAGSAIIAGTSFVVVYVAITRVVRPLLARNSQKISKAQIDRVRHIQEGLGDIRNILLEGSQEVYASKFGVVEGVLRTSQAVNMSYSLLPRFAVEGLGISIIVLLTLVLSQTSTSLVAALPGLGALALGAQRLLPLIQKVYLGWSQATGSRQVLLEVLGLLDQKIPPEYLPGASSEPMPFTSEIRFDHVSFRYADDQDLVLSDIDLTVRKGARVGIVGKTGSGKSTLMDLMMGLIQPTEGSLLVDSAALSRDNRRSWQTQISHVPQSMFLVDGTIAENIALGEANAAIDPDRVRQAAHQAQIADQIEKLPEGYETVVGERGVRISGGQRQRIGIARALYKEGSVLVFDEATSALDPQTERDVLAAIDALGRDTYTMFFIGHQASSMVLCDYIIELESGRIVARTERQ